MADKDLFGCAETGTWATSSPNPHVDLSGSVPPGYAITQALGGALATGETFTATILKSAAHWACYSGAVYTTGTPNIVDLSSATLLESLGSLADTDAVQILGLAPHHGSGSSVLLSRQVASDSASIIFALPAGFAAFRLLIDNVLPVLDAVNLNATISTDNASTFIEADYAWVSDYGFPTATEDAVGLASTNAIRLMNSLGNGAAETSSADLTITGAAAGKYLHVMGSVLLSSSVPYFIASTLTGRYHGSSAAVTHLKVVISLGNIASGTFSLWGIY